MPLFRPYAIFCPMLNIRLQRVGRKNDASYRLVAINSKYAARSGKAIEILGAVDFRKTKIEKESFKADKIAAYMKTGAQLSPTVHNLLISVGLIEGKKINVLPKKTPQKKKEEAK